ncbi:TonB-dependent receptor [Rhodohalobacter sp. 614A]|uniref:TonB-dependent receptor n=1 Tax=Rhodohalobacter sp. 614A TaxID=2908649 RepID=UPI001F39F7BA|nr:TonB-dependent receptor [Rhodohalobacter sp. 614A]
MKRIFYSIFSLIILVFPVITSAQVPTQTIRGQVTDEASGASIPGVSIILIDSDPFKGTTTDANGEFRLTNVPVGRQSIRFSFVGYETQLVRDIMVSSAREVVLNIALRESVTEMDALIVQPDQVKIEPINPMAFNSARQLGMEEASRYAGGFDDPARLASSFAGVTGNLGDNAIVIRGNAPKGMLWQMEGISIPTPSHFANVVTIGGGGITALSSYMLGNSDFYTGAFPAEYGNALSGVFDLNIRNGNNQQFEHAFEVGTIGVDAASEGPIGNGGASYLFNYRISSFSLISPLLPEDAGEIMYQNFSYKVNVPTTKAGTFTLWGLGANDRSGTSPEESPEEWIYNQDREDSESPTRFGAIALSHKLLIGENAFLTTDVAATGNGFKRKTERYTDDATQYYQHDFIKNESGKLTAKSILSNKFGPHHSQRIGVIVNRLGYNQVIQETTGPDEPLQTYIDETGHSYQAQIFSQSKISFGRFDITGGLHFHHFELTNSNSVEPRIGVQYQVGSNSWSLSYGRHSQIEPLSFYFSDPENRNLDLAKADHFVAGFTHLFNQNFRMNLEVYYQNLFDVPVVPDSSYSVLNLDNDWFFDDRLENDGKGRNYGVEITLERYLSNGWYGLLTGSVFKSEYRGGDGIWRNTRFDRGYSFVLLGGKEWELRRRNRVRFLSVNGRINLSGGKRYSPVDAEKSQIKREVFYDETRAFSEQEPDVFYADVTVEYRINRQQTSSVWSLQMINVTAQKEFYGYRYNLQENSIDEEKELILIPNISYRIEF